VILIRRLAGRRAAEQAAIILTNLDQVAEDLTAGAIVVLHEDSGARRLSTPPTGLAPAEKEAMQRRWALLPRLRATAVTATRIRH
jgi:hypothetical protein